MENICESKWVTNCNCGKIILKKYFHLKRWIFFNGLQAMQGIINFSKEWQLKKGLFKGRKILNPL